MTAIIKNQDRLFELLPALYQIGDADRNHELRALLRLITKEADALRDDTQQLWDDFFIETCQRWVIPYIGDLVGNIPLHDLDLSLASATAEARFTDLAGPDLKPPGAIRLRADVAKTIYYRRRKGTPPMLEELARDVTGWDAHVVEFFTLLDWNQHLEHLRLGCHGCPDLRRVDVGDRAGGPWDITTHTVDVRRINEWDGWYNIPNIGFFLWRLEAFRLTQITPRAIGGTNWRLTFSPLGQDIPLFSAGRREPGESRMATELTTALPIRAAAFFEDLETMPTPPPPTPSTAYYGDPVTTQASLVVFANGVPLTADQVECTNLENWTVFAQPGGSIVRIDPTRGRLAIPTGHAGDVITVSYFYGFSMETGGGEYSRAKWLVPSPPPLSVSGGGLALNAQIAARPPAPRTVIEIQDDATYLLNTDITLAANESLTLQAADGARPHVQLAGGSIGIQTLGSGASLTLSGLLVEGGLRVEGDLRTLRLLHTTLVPGRSVEQENPGAPTGFSLEVAAGPPAAQLNTELEVQIAFCITGALRIPSHITQLLLLDSIVVGIDRLDGPSIPAVCDTGVAPDISGPPAHIERSTLLGASYFLKLELASESIFTGQVMVDQRQQGCVRFSFVPFGSQTPQQYRCQPALEIAEEKERRKAAAAASGIRCRPAGKRWSRPRSCSGWCRPSRPTAMAGRTSCSCGAPAPSRSGPVPRTARKWACSASSSSRNARAICASGWTSIYPSAWRPGSST